MAKKMPKKSQNFLWGHVAELGEGGHSVVDQLYHIGDFEELYDDYEPDLTEPNQICLQS